MLMATLEAFKSLRSGITPEMRKELSCLFSSVPDATRQRMVEIASSKGVALTTEEVRGFLRAMDDDDEFDDIELEAVALAAVAGGRHFQGG